MARGGDGGKEAQRQLREARKRIANGEMEDRLAQQRATEAQERMEAAAAEANRRRQTEIQKEE